MDEQERAHRRLWWINVAANAPLGLVAAALTASIFGAIYGIPLLLLWWRTWSGTRRSVIALRRTAAFSCVYLTAAAVALVAIGHDDLDSAVDVAALVALLAWIAAMAYVWRRSHLLVVEQRAAT
jgi:hypothetical protein